MVPVIGPEPVPVTVAAWSVAVIAAHTTEMEMREGVISIAGPFSRKFTSFGKT
jgi:hypothetical protein